MIEEVCAWLIAVLLAVCAALILEVVVYAVTSYSIFGLCERVMP